LQDYIGEHKITEIKSTFIDFIDYFWNLSVL
jgi:hypothetical protein